MSWNRVADADPDAPPLDSSHSVSPCADHYTGSCGGGSISAHYGSGSWSGSICTGSKISFDGANAGSPSFAGITQSQNFLTDCTATDGISAQGIVGLSYSSLANTAITKTLFDSIVEESGMERIFSMQCCGYYGGSAAVSGRVRGRATTRGYSSDTGVFPAK